MTLRAWLLAVLAACALVSSARATTNGGAILFTSSRAYVPNVYIVNDDGTDQRLLARDASYPQWSPDGSQLAYLNDAGSLLVARADGSDPRKVGELGYLSSHYAWSPDGTHIAYEALDIYVVSMAGGAVRPLIHGENPAWSPDSARIAFDRPWRDSRAVFTMAVNGSDFQEVADGSDPEWSPDGTTIALTREEPDTYDNQLWLVRPDGSGARQIGPSYEGDEIAGAWSPDGTQIAVETLEGLFIIEAGTGHSHAVAANIRQPYDSVPAWSPDGTRLAISGNDNLWIVDPATGAGTALTHSERYGYANSAPRWDPLARSTAETGGTPVSEDIPPSSVVVNGVLETSAPITGLAADGRRIAVDLDLTRSICPHTEIWESDTRTVQSLSWSDGCWSDICDVACEPATIASSAFAGSQYTRATLWCTFHDCHDRLESASLDAPHLTDVTPDPTDAYGYVRAFADTLLAGDGDLTVHADQVLRHGRTTLWRIQGHVALPLRKVDGKVRRLAVDSGRIATEDANGNITLREADAVAIWHRSFKQKLIRGLALDASRLTVMTTRALVTYDVTSGRRLTTWPLPKDSAKHRALLDMSEGIAVYRDGKTLHSLRVSDGRDIIVASPSHGPVYAQIESSGLFYSFTVPGAERPGRVAFVAFEDLLNALGPT